MNLKLFLITRNNNQGMALPFALGIGVLMVLAGTMMILRSQTDQTHVKAQHSTLEGINAAEVGATRIFAMMNQNPYLAVYPDCVGRDSNGNCTDSGTNESQKSWANATNFPEISLCDSEEVTNLENIALNQNWQPIDPNNPQNGEYRLVSYEYENPGVAPGTGKLTVEGRIDNNKEVLASASKITVEIPVSPDSIDRLPSPKVGLENDMDKCNFGETVINLGGLGNNKQDGRLTTTSGNLIVPKSGDISR